MSPEERNRRLEPRVVGEEIKVEYLSPVPRIRDLSTSGFFILDPRPFQRGQTVEFRLTLGSNKPFKVTGMVRRVEPGQGMAIEFIHIDADSRRLVKEFISRSDPKKVTPAHPDFE